MRRLRLPSLIAVVALLATPGLGAAQLSSDSFTVPISSLGGGGSIDIGADTGQIAVTFSQASPIGVSSNQTGEVFCSAGLWAPAGGPISLIACLGDCNGDSSVAINELVTGVAIALGNRPVNDCPAFDADRDGQVRIGELIGAVNNALRGCDG